jgi:FkbM family methyltransferase
MLERRGIRRIPALSPIAHGVWRAVFGDRAAGDSFIIHVHGVALEVPASSLPNYLDQEYEPVTTQILLNAVTRGAVVVDVGAHIGYYACLAARAAGPTGRVHAIEPAATNVAVLRRNAARNGFANLTIHDVAASSTSGSRRFLLTDASDSHGFYDHPLAHITGTTTVETRSVDALVPGPVHVIKIDVEGAELDVLAGMTDLLTTSSGAITIVEWNPECLAAADIASDDLPAMMRSVGIARIAVLDDHRRLIRPLREVQTEIRAGGLPEGWYVNLCGTVQ